MKKYLLLLLIVVPILAQAQTDSLLLKYRAMALDYQQAVKIAQKGLEGAESMVEVSKAAYLPHVDADGSYKYNGKPIQLGATAEDPSGVELSNIYSIGVWVSQPVYMGGYLKNTKGMAMAQSDVARSYINLSKQSVMLEADARYLAVVAKNEYSNLSVKYRDAIGEFLGVIQDRVDEEIVGMNELYQARVRFNDAQYEVIRMTKEYQLSLMELNRLIGVELNTPSNHTDTLFIINWSANDEQQIDRALEARPEISMRESELAINRYNEKRTASYYNPKISVGAGGTYGAPSPGLLVEPGTNYHVSAQLAVPIYYWGQKRNEVFAKKKITEQSQLQYENTVDQIKLEVASAYYELTRSKEQVDFAYSALDNAASNVDVMMDRYREGLSSVLEVLDAQLFWQKTYLNFIESKLELNMSYSLYQKAMGELSTVAL